MKPSRLTPRSRRFKRIRSAIPYLAALGMAAGASQGATLTWESGMGITVPATGTWGASNAWRDADGNSATWVNGSDAVFSGTGVYTVTLGAAATVNNALFTGNSVSITPTSSGSTSAQTLTLNGVLSTTGTSNVTINANITGAGSMVLNSIGQINLTGWNNFTGGVTLNSGTLAINTGNSAIITGTGSGQFSPIGTGTLTINGGTIYMNAFGASNSALANAIVVGGNFSAQTASLAGTVDLGGAPRTITTIITGNTLTGITLSGVVSNGGIIVGNGIAASSVALTNTANTFTGGVTINSFSRVFVSGTVLGVTPLGTGTLTMYANSTIGTQSNTGQIRIGNAIKLNGDINVSNNSGSFSGALDLGGATRTITNVNNGATSFTGTITNGGVILATAGLNAPSAVGISGAADSTFAGGVTVNNRAILSVSGTSITSSGVVISGPLGTGTLTLKNGSGLAAGQFTKIYNNIVVAGDFTNTSNAGAMFYGGVYLSEGNHTITQGNTTSGLNLYGNITGSGGLTLTGPLTSGGFTLGGTSSYTGTTVVTNGAGLTVNGLITNSTTLDVNGGASISGANGTINANLVVNNASVTNGLGSTLTLNGSNTFRGISTLGRSGSSGNVVMTNGFTLADGLLTIIGTTTTSSTASTIALKGGVLALQSGSALSGSSAISFGGGTLRYGSLNVVDYSARIKNSTGAISVDTNGQDVIYDTALENSNTGGLTKLGSGMLTLTKANAYSGATTVNNGTLKLDFSAGGAPASNIVNSSSALVLGGGSLSVTGAASTVNAQTFSGLTVNSGASAVVGVAGGGGSVAVALGNITRNAGGTVDFTLPSSGAISTASGAANTLLTHNGVAYATVGGADWAAKDASNGYIVGGSSISGFYTANDAVTVSGNADMSGGVDTALTASTTVNSLRFNNAGARTLGLGGNTLTTGGILSTSAVGAQNSTITNGTLQGVAGQDLVIIQNNTAGALNIGATIANNGGATGLTKAGAGTVQLTQAASYTGTTAITAGTLQLGVANAIAASSLVSLANGAGATLDLAGNTQSIRSLTGGGMVTSSGTAATLVISGEGSTYEGSLQNGAGLSLTMAGSGTQTLTGANTYTGVTTITGGVLSISSLAGTQTPTLTTTSGTNKALVSSTVGLTVGMAIKANGVPDGTTIAAIVNSGTITLSSAATSTVASGTASFITPNALGQASSTATNLVINGGTLQYTGQATATDRLFSIGNSGATLDASGIGALTLSGTGALGFNGQSGARTLTLTGINTGTNALTALIGDNGGATSVVKNGSGMWSISGTSNTYTGVTAVNNGILGFRGVGSLGTNASLTLGVAAASSGTLQYSGGAGTLSKTITAQGNGGDTIQNVGSGLLTLSGSISRNATAIILNGGNYGIKVTGAIGGASAGSDLIINGGLAILSATNTYNGNTYINGGGLLNNGVSNALPTATTLYIGGADNSTGLFDLSGYNQTLAGLYSLGNAGADNIVSNYGAVNSTLTVTGGGSFGGRIQDGSASVSLAVTGGNFIMSGSNTYSGSTSVSSGTLSVNGSLGSSSVTVASGAALAGSGTIGGVTNSSGAISGGLAFGSGLNVTNGSVNGSGLSVTGTTTFSGTSSLAGTMNSSSGIRVAVGSALNVTGQTTSNITVDNALLKGTGAVGNVVLASGTLNGTLSTGAIRGTGLVSPGGSPGILTATSVTSNATDGLLNFAFELTTQTPNYATASNSLNDILHITSSGGLSLGEGTNISVYFASLTAGARFDGGFFVDNMTTDALNAAISSATFAFYVQDALGSTEFNGVNYSLFDHSKISISAIGVTAGFASGSASGAELEFTVVPEPSTWAMIIGGFGVLAFGQRMRRRMS